MKILRPTRCNFITQKFGENAAPFYAELGLKGHNGLDYAMYGEEILYWNGYDVEGRVIETKIYSDGCYVVQILTEDKDGAFLHMYAHLKSFLCKPGDILSSGSPIGIGDNTGKYTTGKHLHYGLKPVKVVNNTYQALDPNNGYGGYIDPLPYMKNEYILDILSGYAKMLVAMKELLIKMKNWNIKITY